jgi:hypothetical protein
MPGIVRQRPWYSQLRTIKDKLDKLDRKIEAVDYQGR